MMLPYEWTGRVCLLEHLIRVDLRWVENIRVVEQILDTHHQLRRQLESRSLALTRILTALTVIEGFHCFSSSRIERQIVPDG